MTSVSSQAETTRVPVAPGVSLSVRAWPGSGTEPAFVLVHGLASNARLWDGVAARLGEYGHAVATVDQRGHGLSDKPDEGYDFTTVTDDLASVLGALGYDRPVLVGQSWGGNVVLEYGWRFPTTVRGVVGVDGGTIELGERFRTWDEVQKVMSPPPLVGRRVDEIEAMLRTMHPDWPDAGIAGTMANFEIRPDGTVAPWLSLERHLMILRALWEHRPSTRYADLEVPVLLVAADGGDEQMTKMKRLGVHAAVTSIPRVRVEWIRGDHDLHAQHPQRLADLLHDLTAEGFFA